MSNKSKRFPPEFRDRAARMVLEEEKNHPSGWSAVMMIAPKLDIHPDTLSKWTRVHERANAPAVSDLPDREKSRQLERENRELRQANEILRKVSADIWCRVNLQGSVDCTICLLCLSGETEKSLCALPERQRAVS